MSYIISVVVPTKNRFKYVKSLIELVDSFNLKNDLELVIQDNSDDNAQMLSFLGVLKNDSIKYYYNSEPLTMAQNCNEGIKNATGEYVCMIGDDDAVCRNIVSLSLRMKREYVDVAKTSLYYYYWKDFNMDRLNRNLCGILQYSVPSNKTHQINANTGIQSLLKHGFQYVGSDIPGLYNCIVKRSVLNEIALIGGTCFPGASPDISIAVCLCFYSKKCVFYDFPVIISGISKMAGGGVVKKGKHVVPLEEVSFISRDIIANWEHCIPKVWCGKYAWAESGIKALKYVHREDMLKYYSHNYMLANSVVFHRELFRTAYSYSVNRLSFLCYIVIIASGIILKKLTRFFFNKHKIVSIESISDIKHAETFAVKLNDQFNIDLK